MEAGGSKLAGVKLMGPAKTGWMCGGTVLVLWEDTSSCLQTRTCRPVLLKHWWVCGEKCTGARVLGTSKVSLPPESKEEKTSVDAKDPCMESEVERPVRLSLNRDT